MSLAKAKRPTSRRTGSKPLTITTPGVSSIITSTPETFSKARILRPSRPMMRPFISSLGMSTVFVVWGRRLRGGESLHRRHQCVAAGRFALFGHRTFVLQDALADLVREVLLHERHQALFGFGR